MKGYSKDVLTATGSAAQNATASAKDSALDFAISAADWIVAKLPESTAKRPSTLPELRLIAHRGAWKDRGCLENTFSAFDRAREAGVWGLEFDVRFTKDDVPVVHHDESLLRTFGRPLLIENLTLSTLKHEAPDVPTLAETVAEYGKSMHLFIEIKDSRSHLTDLRFKRILEPCESAGLRPEENFHFMSFHIPTLEAFNQRLGLSRRALVSIATTNPTEISDYTLNSGLKGFTCHWVMMSQAILQRHHSVHQVCGVGFANSKKSLHREWARGIDWIFTNEAPAAVDWLNELTK
jgi:glycerophosphoryl diester phosphodiesterase